MTLLKSSIKQISLHETILIVFTWSK